MKKPVEIISLETKDDSNLWIDKVKTKNGYSYLPKLGKLQNNGLLCVNIYLYVTVSQDVEEIKEGDWIICSDYNNSYQVVGKISHIGKPFNFKNTLQINGNKDLHINRHNLDYCKKIIATTDPKVLKEHDDSVPYPKMKRTGIVELSKSFLKEFVANPNGKWEVEYVKYFKSWETRFDYTWKVKLNQDNTVNITLAKEPKTKFNYDDITHAIAYGHNKAKQGVSHHQALINYKEANNIQYVRGNTYSTEEVEEMLFSISTALCWDDKDPEELIEHCQKVISEIRKKLT